MDTMTSSESGRAVVVVEVERSARMEPLLHADVEDADALPAWHSRVLSGQPVTAAHLARLRSSGAPFREWIDDPCVTGAARDVACVFNGVQSNLQSPFQFVVVDSVVVRPAAYAAYGPGTVYGLDAETLANQGFADVVYWVWDASVGKGGGSVMVQVEVVRGDDGIDRAVRVSDGVLVTTGWCAMPLVVNGSDASDAIVHVDPQCERIGPNSVLWQIDRAAAFTVVGADASGSARILAVVNPITVPELVALLLDTGFVSAGLMGGSADVAMWVADSAAAASGVGLVDGHVVDPRGGVWFQVGADPGSKRAGELDRKLNMVIVVTK